MSFFKTGEKDSIKFLRDCFTGVDGTTWDLARVMWGLGVAAVLLPAFLQGIALGLRVIRIEQPVRIWESQDWAIWSGAFGVAMAASAASVYVKRSTEPSVLVTRTRDDGDGNTATTEVKT